MGKGERGIAPPFDYLPEPGRGFFETAFDADAEVEREGEETNSVGDSDGENDDRPEGSGGTIENNKEAETSKTTKILKVIFIITIVIALQTSKNLNNL